MFIGSVGTATNIDFQMVQIFSYITLIALTLIMLSSKSSSSLLLLLTIIIIIIIIIMQTFIQDILHIYTYTYVHTVVNNSSVTHKVRCYQTLVTARKEYMRTHPILTALIGIYTRYLHSIVSPAVRYILRLQDCFLDYRYCYVLWQILKIGRYKKFIYIWHEA